MSDIPWEEIDKGIRDRVEMCERLGLGPTSSCDGHGKEFPWVVVDHADFDHIEEKLREHGDEPFRIYRIRTLSPGAPTIENTVIEWGLSIRSAWP